MHFLDLNYDVLLRTLTFLDVTSIMRCTEVCSAFQRLAQSKHVWLAVVYNLGRQNLLSLPPRDTLPGYSATQLIQEVKRAVFGPWTWAPTSSQAPVVRRRIHVSMSGPSTSSACEPTLLFGDRHLLVKRGTGCEIWDVAENRPVWARDGVIRSNMLARPVQNGTELLIALWSGRPSPCVSKFRSTYRFLTSLFRLARDPKRLDCNILMRTLVLDLKTNSETPLLPIQLPRNFTKFSDVVMADDFWAANVEWFGHGAGWYSGVLIVNWRDHIFVLLRYRLAHKKLLPGHLLALTKAAEASDVVLYPWAAFDPHWQPLNTITLARAAHSALRIPPLVLQRVEYPVLPGYRTPLMSVHDCLLNHGSYIVSTHTASTYSLPADSEICRLPSLHRYRLTLPTASYSVPVPLGWKKISSAGAINRVFMHSLTYAGYGLAVPSDSRPPTTQIVCRPATGEDAREGTWTVPLPAQKFGGVCLSPNTGALTVCSAGGADVYYYE
ncbi:hypothetical protein B0H14DRAFT_2723305 [Mycena olivaceomarginata]|nr:hypothetical protein B0H14DRAFT_2723305 [Mycena olivaceomarginata]